MRAPAKQLARDDRIRAVSTKKTPTENGPAKNGVDEYLALVRQYPLRPIRSDKQLDKASRVLDELLDRGALSPWIADYREVLEGLILRYEDEHSAIAPLPDREMLAQLIEAKGVAQVEVARRTGIVESTISAVLAGRRTLTRQQIAKLSRFFGVTADVFAAP